jgi:hypothetical protein
MELGALIMAEIIITDEQIITNLRNVAESKYRRRFSVLARKLKWDRSKLWRLLTGEQAMRLGEFLLLCNALGLLPSSLLQIVGA